MASVPDSLRLAIAHHQAGRLSDAATMYRQVLTRDPENPDALQLLGVVALQSGNATQALELIRRALARRPTDGQAYYNLGNAQQALGDAEGALASFRKAVGLAPQMAEAHGNLGTLLAMRGQLDEAIVRLREAVRRAPRYLQGWSSLGNALRETGELAEAIECYRTALRLSASFMPAQFGLGLALAQSGRSEEAERAYLAAAKLAPDNLDIWNNLGTLYRVMQRRDEALDAFQRVVALNPRFAPGHYNIGLVLADLGRAVEAEAAHRQAIALDPSFAQAHDSLGLALQGQERLGEAVDSYRRALALRPGYAVATTNLATALQAQGRLDEAIEALRGVLAANPTLAAAHSNLLMVLQYSPEQAGASLLRESQAWGKAHGSGAAPRAHTNARDPERPLRIGYVSADFRAHSCAWFLEPLLAAHDQSRYIVACFFGAAHPDAVTDRFKRVASVWRETAGLSDAAFADLVAGEGIDILVDCTGHTAASRLPAFALKPAPVQVTWLGYPGTTGLPAIDYRLADAVADPPGAEEFSSETLVRLPRGFLCYGPPASAPDVAPLPARKAGHVTFGSFNNPAKMNAGVIAAWASALAAVPGSRLVLKAKQFSDAATRALFLERLTAGGCEAGSVDLLAAVKGLDAHLAHYGRVDIALDPFPYNGTTTTCEALWMGVPVVTLCGERHASRVGASLLTRVGLEALIVGEVDGYVAAAVRLAGDLDHLAALRAGLRERMAASPLTDAARFARDMEDAYREMWRRYCSSTNPA
jgi:protein O-GlcNAc transferase